MDGGGVLAGSPSFLAGSPSKPRGGGRPHRREMEEEEEGLVAVSPQQYRTDEEGEEHPSALSFPRGCHGEGEECGICADPVSTPGLLDCCSHVFCFACIHTWSAITNLCPLCKSQFKFITFSEDADGDETFDAETQQTFFNILENEREEDGEDTVFAFPSCFIDEDAIVCLDGDGCKVRAGYTTEDKLKNDTSVACDSCDCWYHSICVGYDPSNVSQRSWQCPRCVGTDTLGLSWSTCSLQDKMPALEKQTFVSEEHLSEGQGGIVPGSEITEIACSVAFETTEMIISSPNTLPNVNNSEVEKNILIANIKPQSTCLEDQGICTEFDSQSLENSETCSVANINSSITFYPALEVLPIKEASSYVNSTLDLAAENKDAASNIQRPIVESALQNLPIESAVNSHKVECRSLTELAKGAIDDKVVGSDVQQFTAMNVSKYHPLQQAVGSQKLNLESLSDLKDLVKGPPAKVKCNIDQTVFENTMVRDREIRTRKIVRRGNESDRQSTFIVEEIQKQLRKAVGSGAAKDLGQVDITDDRFLAAFKAAITGSVKHGLRKSMKASIQERKLCGSILTRKGSRLNLTKKLYGRNGKRHKAWDRDWDIAFWKEKVLQMKKARREAMSRTLGTEEEEMFSCSKEDKEESDPIFTRLYFADTSLLPRQEYSKNSGTVKQSANNCRNDEKTTSKSSLRCLNKSANSLNSYCRPSQKSSSDTQWKKDEDIKCEGKNLPQAIISQSDKRKWALEVLSKKTGQATSNSTGELLSKKQSSSLLDEIPMDMRPVLEYDRRSRVPTAIRQVQLNRFIEHYLRKENIKNAERTPECASIIAAAVNKERDIYDKSNSKGVYSNLCVQALSYSDNQTIELTKSVCPESTSLDIDMNDEVVVHALKATGLISDSLPGTPVMVEENNCSLETERSTAFGLECVLALENCKNLENKPEDFFHDISILPGSQNMTTIAEVNESVSTSMNEMLSPSPALDGQRVCSTLQGEEGEDVKLHQMSRDPEVNHATGESNAEPSTTVTNNENVVQQGLLDGQATRGKCITDCMDTEPKLIVEGAVSDNSKEQAVGECAMVTDPPVNGTSISVNRVSVLLENESDHLEKNLGSKQLQQPSVCALSEASLDVESDKISVECFEKHTQRPMITIDKEKSSQPIGATQVVWKKVEKYIKEHLRPFHKSGVITTEQYRWGVAKTTNKVMQYHTDAKSADFIISEGDKVKKLAEQYLKLFKQKKHV